MIKAEHIPTPGSVHGTKGDWRVVTISSREELEPYRADWERLQHHPNADFSFYTAFVKEHAHTMKPWVMLCVRDGDVQAIVAGRLERARIGWKLGYWSIQGPAIRSLAIIYGGLMGDFSDGVYERIGSELESMLKCRAVDAINYHYLAKDSRFYALLQNCTGVLCRDRVATVDHHWKMRMPETSGEMFQRMKSKHRCWLRRLPKALEKAYPGKVEMKVFKREEDIDSLGQDAEHVAQKTYQRGLRVGFVNTSVMRDNLRREAKNGRLFGYVLSVNSRPCAFWIATSYRHVLHLHYTGYETEFHRFEVGTIVLVKLMEDVRRDRPEIEEVDFGFGDAPYKRKFGNLQVDEISGYVFAPAFRPVAINLARTLVGVPPRLLKKTVEQLALERRIKKLWRLRLARKTV